MLEGQLILSENIVAIELKLEQQFDDLLVIVSEVSMNLLSIAFDFE